MNILILSLDNLGDAVMASALIDPLIEDGHGVGVFVKSYTADLFRGDPRLKAVHAADPFWDTSPGRPRGAWRPFLKAWRDIRRVKYEACLVLGTDWRRSLVARGAGIPSLWGVNRKGSGYFLHHGIEPKTQVHVVEEHRLLAEQFLGRRIKTEECQPSLWVDPSLVAQTRERIEERGWTVAPWMFHPSAGDPRRMWPEDSWKCLVDRTLRKNIPCVILAGSAEELSTWGGLETHPLLWVLAGAGWGRVKALMTHCRGFVGVDSGPGHVAAALGRPVLSLFGVTLPSRYAPRGTRVQVLQTGNLKLLAVNEVEDALEKLVK